MHIDADTPQAAHAHPSATDNLRVGLEDLAALDAEALCKLYLTARVPNLEEVAGDLRGRMLAVVGLPELLAGPVRTFAASRYFPWRGKTFSPRDRASGEGKNRIISDALKLFRFETSVAPSRAGAFQAVELDYDLPENPFFIRAIKDEIRELRDGLWLGQAYLQIGTRPPRLVLYFGLQRT